MTLELLLESEFKVWNFFQLSWLLVYFAQNVYYLYAARLLLGVFGGGSYTIAPLFLSEIAQDQ